MKERKLLNLEFPTTIPEAREFQKELSKEIILADSFATSDIIGAFDIAYKADIAFAACVLYDISKRTIIEEKTIKAKVEFPYVPGYLFMREVPHFLVLLDKLETKPDITIIDGHGIAHPKTAGSATIFGVMTDTPSIGVAKKPMKNFNYKKTKTEHLEIILLNKQQVGFRHSFERRWNPIYISPGHKISIETSYLIVSQLLTDKYKLPIPQQSAHLLAAKSKTPNS